MKVSREFKSQTGIIFQLAIGNWQSEISYQIPGSVQRLLCETRQAGNGATVAIAACVAGQSGVWPIQFPVRTASGSDPSDAVLAGFAGSPVLTSDDPVATASGSDKITHQLSLHDVSSNRTQMAPAKL